MKQLDAALSSDSLFRALLESGTRRHRQVIVENPAYLEHMIHLLTAFGHATTGARVAEEGVKPIVLDPFVAEVTGHSYDETTCGDHPRR